MPKSMRAMTEPYHRKAEGTPGSDAALRFGYRAIGLDGRTLNSELAAASHAEALARLTQNGLTVLALDVLPPRLAVRPSRARQRQFASFCDDLGMLLTVGHTLESALGVLKTSARASDLRGLMAGLQDAISSGASLSVALQRTPGWASEEAVAVIAASEGTGRLGEAVKSLAAVGRRQAAFEDALSGALIYPSVLAFGALAAVSLVLNVAAPRLREAFEGMPTRDGEQPFALLDAAGWVAGGLMLAVLLIGFCVLAARRHAEGRLWVDRQVLKLPWLGAFMREASAARVCRSLALALSAGVRPERALAAAAPAAGNLDLRRALYQASRQMEAGSGFGEALLASAVLPGLAADALVVADQAGAIAGTADRLADAYEERTQRSAMMLARLAEPALIALAGVVIGLAAFSMLSALTSLSEGVQ